MHEPFDTPSGFLPERIVHLHPTTRCNLACRHCYSESAPELRDTLHVKDIVRVLTLLRGEGYRQVSISGGEPLMYAELPTVVREAQALGFRVTMITNGLLVSSRHDAVLSQLDGMAISFDGLQATHDDMRGRSGVFVRALSALQALSSTGLPIAAAVSVTRPALAELPDLVELLVEHGAQAVQVRPVANAGRAQTLDSTLLPRDVDRLRLFLVMQALAQELGQRPGTSPRLHCDVVPAAALWRQRSQYASLLNASADQPAPLSALVNPLVITDRGVLRPLAFDMAPVFDIGTVENWSPESLRTYHQHGLPRLQQLISTALSTLQWSDDVVDWFDVCARHSQAPEWNTVPRVIKALPLERPVRLA
jgi:Fe-coproporphyrin III synthase